MMPVLWSGKASYSVFICSIMNTSCQKRIALVERLRNKGMRPRDDNDWKITPMAIDYDAPREQDEELKTDSLDELKSRRSDQSSGSVDQDETEAAEDFMLPGADLSSVELSVDVIPAQDDEFTCSQCFLVHHRSQLAYEEDGLPDRKSVV